MHNAESLRVWVAGKKMSSGKAKVHPKVSCHHCSSLEENPCLFLVSAAGPSPLATFRGVERRRAERGGHMASGTSELPIASCRATAKWPARGSPSMQAKRKIQFSGSPVAGNKKVIILLFIKSAYERVCKFFKLGS